MNQLHQKSAFKMTMIMAMILALTACDKPNAPQGPKGPPTVITMTVTTKDIPVSVTLPGRTAASLIAEVRPQVGGIILSQEFKEGGLVAKNTPLYHIDPSSYDASLAQAQANLESAKANQNAVKIKTNRLRNLVKSNAVSKQDVDDAEAALLQADAGVLLALATVKSAQINVDYTKVFAPITGQIGRSTVTQGALVTPAQANPLATIQQLDPMKVDITYPSAAFVDIKQRIKEGKIKVEGQQFGVSLVLESGKIYAHKGQVTFTDPTVDPSTGTILIQAEFPNPDLLLLPGMFVSVVIEQGVEENAIAIPQKSVSRTPKGDALVYRVSKGEKGEQVSSQIVHTSRTEGDKWVIESGLSAGDQIMVEGFGPLAGMRGGSMPVVVKDASPSEIKK